MNRVVVTGIGVIAPGSIGKENFWENIVSGNVFTGPITMFDCDNLRIQIAGEIKAFKDDEYIECKNGIDTNKLERIDRLAIKATQMAIDDSGLELRNGREIAVSLGTTMGNTFKNVGKKINYEIYENLIDKKNNLDYSELQSITPVGIMSNVCKYFNLKGAKTSMFLNACAAGNYSIGWGYDKVKSGDAKIAIVGGVESLNLTAIMGFNRLLSLTPDICRPFDKNRKGLVVSEGCAILVLESLESALKRHAHIYGEIRGYGLSTDAYHITSPRPDASGIVACIQEALKKSGLKTSDIDYISAHGTGTKANDEIESKALLNVFNKGVPPISSIKSMIGHSLGAAAAIEAVASLLMIQNNEAVPTANFEQNDENCPVDCIPNKSRKIKIDNILSNAFAFGGNNACLVISRYLER